MPISINQTPDTTRESKYSTLLMKNQQQKQETLVRKTKKKKLKNSRTQKPAIYTLCIAGVKQNNRKFRFNLL